MLKIALKNIGSLFQDLIYTIYPSLCLMCNENQRIKEDIFCFECYSTLPFTDHFQLIENSASDHLSGRVKMVNVASLLYFYKSGNVQELLHNLKYKNKPEVGIRCGEMIAEKMMDSEFFQDIDYLIPLPIHSKKLRQRGYNQSEKIADGISNISSIPVLNNVLIKNRNTTSQTHLHRHERVSNVQNTFSILNPELIKNKNVLIVDDVITTGATVEVAALKLESSLVKSISLVTIAIAT
jgi:ComF family protein